MNASYCLYFLTGFVFAGLSGMAVACHQYGVAVLLGLFAIGMWSGAAVFYSDKSDKK